MSDISEAIQEPIDEAPKSKINSRVALFVAITATFMALCNVKDGNIVQAMSQAQAHSIDAWSYFQAKSTKQSIAENTLELLKMQNASQDAIKKTEEQENKEWFYHMARDHFAYVGAYRKCIDEIAQYKKDVWSLVLNSKTDYSFRIQA